MGKYHTEIYLEGKERGRWYYSILSLEHLLNVDSECCSKVTLSSTGAAATKQWDRMGTYIHTGQTLHGRLVYKHQDLEQHIFYIYGEFDGWLLGRGGSIHSNYAPLVFLIVNFTSPL